MIKKLISNEFITEDVYDELNEIIDAINELQK